MLDYGLDIVTPATAEPVTVSEAKARCQVFTSDDDTLVGDLIAAARELVERDTGRVLMRSTLALQRANWPESGRFEIPRIPLVSVTELKYMDTAGAWQVVDAQQYTAHSDREPALVVLASTFSRPSVLGALNAIRLTFVAGYASAALVPARAKQAIFLLVAHWYRVREAVGCVEGQTALTYDALIRSLKIGVYP